MKYTNKDERRLKIVFVPQEYVFSLFQRGLIAGNTLHCPKVVAVPDVQIPADAMVRGVHYDYQRNAFGFIIWSAEFDTVTPGLLMPEVKYNWDTVAIAAKPIGGKK